MEGWEIANELVEEGPLLYLDEGADRALMMLVLGRTMELSMRALIQESREQL